MMSPSGGAVARKSSRRSESRQPRVCCDRSSSRRSLSRMSSDDSSKIGRRDALLAVAVTSATFVAGCRSHRNNEPAPVADSAKPGAPAMPTPKALDGSHKVVPLPFKPSALTGLSEKMIGSHHENNYSGAVKNLNKVEQELAAINKDTPGFMVAALRERELTFRNSKTLHELYFANLGGDGKRSGTAETALSQAYGASSSWEDQFRATGMGLGGGSGWVVLGYELETGALRTTA